MRKGSMPLIDAAAAEALYAAMGPAIESQRRLGGQHLRRRRRARRARCAYLGKVRRRPARARCSRHDIAAAGVHFPTPPADRRRAHRALPDPGDAGRRSAP